MITPDGTAVAFPTSAAKAALANGQTVAAADVEVYTDGAGLRTRTPDGSDLAAHQSFWFAWSQFHPDTILWEPSGTTLPLGRESSQHPLEPGSNTWR